MTSEQYDIAMEAAEEKREEEREKVATAMMAEGDIGEEAQENIAAQVEAGNFKSEFIKNDDADDAARIESEAFAKTAIDARGRVHEWADAVEIFAEAMLTDALDNKAARGTTLSKRFNLLKALYKFRDTSDCEDDFQNEEFHGQMRQLATIQRKLRSLDSKIGAMMHGAEASSSDSEGDGEKDEIVKLKNARQNLRYALNPGTFTT
jgi:hypothetical protein